MPHKTPVLSPQMNANVMAIMHEDPEQNFTLNETPATVHITEDPKPSAYYLEVTFHNQVKEGLTYTNPDTGQKEDYFELIPMKIRRFVLDQDFAGNHINHYELNVALTVQQYLLLYYNYKDLKCNLKLYYADIVTGKVEGIDTEGEPAMEIINAMCIFKNRQDILKRVPKEAVIPEDPEHDSPSHHDQLLDDILFQIIPTEDWAFRATQINGIFNQTTIEKAIWGLAFTASTVEALMLMTPDNTKEYRNLIIPPVLTMEEALTFLQRQYGVYNKGFSFFYEFGILYVYPAYDTQPTLPKDKSEAWGSGYKKTQYTTVNGPLMMDETGDGGMTHIYAAGNLSFPGAKYYHGYEKNTIHIVATGNSVYKNMADEGIENNGYGFIVAHGGRIIDEWRTILEAKDQKGARHGVYQINVQQTPNLEYLVEDKQNEHIGVTSTKANIDYIEDMGNPFLVQSQLHAYRRTMVVFQWEAAVPLTFRPGYKICYHFDHEDETKRDIGKAIGESLEYQTRYGSVEQATYDFTIGKKIDSREFLTCKATVTAQLDMEQTQHKEGM